MKILKIRCRANGTIIKFASEGLTCPLSFDAQASEELVKALDDLKPVVGHILGLGEPWLDKLTVTGLTPSPSGDANYKVVIVAKRDMAVGSPFNVSTPIRYLYQGAEDEKEVTKLALPEVHAKLISKATRQAELFVLGARPLKQMFLFDMGKPAKVVEGELVGETPKKKGKGGRKKKAEKPTEGAPLVNFTPAGTESEAAAR